MGVLQISILLLATAALCSSHIVPASRHRRDGVDFVREGVNEIAEIMGDKVGEILDDFKDKADDLVDSMTDVLSSDTGDGLDDVMDGTDDSHEDTDDAIGDHDDGINDDSHDSIEESDEDIDESIDEDSDENNDEDSDEDIDDDDENDEDSEEDTDDSSEDVDEVIDGLNISDLEVDELDGLLDDLDNEIVHELDVEEIKNHIKERRAMSYRRKRWVPLALGAARVAFGAARALFRGSARRGAATWRKTKKGDRVRTQKYDRRGDYSDARRDFERFKPSERSDFSIGSRGKVGNHEVKVRSSSSDGRPTLEIHSPRGDGATHIRKFRYNKN